MEELTPSSIARIQELVAAGDVLRASALLDELGDTTGCPDPVLHRELGMLAEQLGQLERALAEYNQALRAAPAQSSVLRRLARLRADRGELKQAERAYRRLLELEPGDAEASLELGALLEDRGEPEQAAALYGVAAGAPGDRLRQQEPRLEQAARRLARTAAGSGAGRAAGRATGAPPGREEEREGRVALEGRGRDAAGHDEDEEGAEERAPSDADLITFSTLFSGREGVHARQWVSPSGRHGYTPVHEPFTPAVARGHLLGSYTVGIYPVRMDNTARFLAFDLDVARFALGRAGSGGRGLDGLLALSRRAAVRLIDAAASLEMVALLESSGWKGLHVWIFFAVPVPAAALRRLGQALLRRAGPLPAEVTVELFPKQSRVAEGSLGNLIKLPLGVHRVTGSRSLLVGVDGRPLADPLAALRDVARVPRQQLTRLLAELDGGGGPFRGRDGAGGPGGPDPENRPQLGERAGNSSERGRVVPFPGARRSGEAGRGPAGSGGSAGPGSWEEWGGPGGGGRDGG